MKDSVKVYLRNKHKIASYYPNMIWSGTWERELYCWEFKWSDGGKFYIHSTKNSIYYMNKDFTINRINRHPKTWKGKVSFNIEKELGAVYCETLKGRFYWK